MAIKTPLVMGYEVVIASDMQLLICLYEVGWAEIQVEGERLNHTIIGDHHFLHLQESPC